jgi:peptidyl-tRNA hydrolase
MPKLETVIIASEPMRKPGQGYKKVVTWFNIPSRPDFFNWVYQKQKYDIFGIIFHPFRFSSRESLSKIVEAFNLQPEKILCIHSEEEIDGKRCIFINKGLANMEHIDGLESIIEYGARKNYKVFSVKGLFDYGEA